MPTPAVCPAPASPARSRGGFTLVEILVATALTLLMMGMIVTIFALVTDTIRGSSAGLELADRLRAAKDQLQLDLDGVTVKMSPPRRPESDEGYFELIEGPVGPVIWPTEMAAGNDDPDTPGVPVPDTTVGDLDDVLMFTTRTAGAPFVGRFTRKRTDGTNAWLETGTVESQVAEVAWFVRGTTLYRRMLLVLPNPPDWDTTTAEYEPLPHDDTAVPISQGSTVTSQPLYGYYNYFDLSARAEGDPDPPDGFRLFDIEATPGGTPRPLRLVPNSLGDLTKREHRYGHQPHAYPFDARFWGPLGLPTLRECTAYKQLSSSDELEWRWPFPVLPRPPSTHGPPHGADPALYTAVDGPIAVKGIDGAEPLGRDATKALNTLVVPAGVPYDGSALVGFANLRHRLDTADTANWFDALLRPDPWGVLDRATGTLPAFGADPFPDDDPLYSSQRLVEDVILTDVLSFDVEVWDPGAPLLGLFKVSGEPLLDAAGNPVVLLPGDEAYLNKLNALVGGSNEVRVVGYGAYVDLNYMCRLEPDAPPPPPPPPPPPFPNYPGLASPDLQPHFHHAGQANAPIRGHDPIGKIPPLGPPPNPPPNGTYYYASVYDTWSTHYEADGLNQADNHQLVDGMGNKVPLVDEGTDGFDNDGVGGIDDAGELEAPPPYAAPLRGIRIKIRVYEPDSRQIRDVTVVQEFTTRNP